jgi:hypothetical protein
VPDGSLCTASVEQMFPRDGVQRNCFELALYIMTGSPIASVRVFETALPTLYVRDRAIIVLNDHWSGDMLLALQRRSNSSHRPSMAMPLAATPYRASGLVR